VYRSPKNISVILLFFYFFSITTVFLVKGGDLVHAQVGQNVTFGLVVNRLTYVWKYGATLRIFSKLSDAIFLLQKISKFVNTTQQNITTTHTTINFMA